MKMLVRALHGWLGAIVLVALFSVAVNNGAAKEPAGTDYRGRPIAVVERGDLELTVRASATLEPEAVVDVYPTVPGIITKFGADAAMANKEIYWGSKVDAGTPLAYIDDSQYRDALEAARLELRRSEAVARGAKATAKEAAADLDRLQKLMATPGVASPEQADRAKTALSVAQAGADAAEAQVDLDKLAIKRAQAHLDRTIIRSPVKGVVIDRRVNIGQVVRAGDDKAPSLFLLASDLSKMHLWISISDSDIHQIRVGQKIRFSVDALAGMEFDARVNQIRLNATMNNNVVTYTVTAAVDNSKGLLLPYEVATATIVTAKHENVLIVPRAAFEYASRPGGLRNAQDAGKNQIVVIVVDGNSERTVAVTPGDSDGAFVEVKSGELKEGMQVVIGSHGLR